MFEKLKKTIDSHWARSKAFKIIIITAFFLFMAIAIFLSTVYVRILLGISFSILVIIARLVFGYVARKEGYVEKAKELSPKHYSYVRRVECIVCGGLFTGFAILTTLTALYGPLPYPQSFLLFLILIAVGAIIGDIVGRKLRRY